MTEATMFFILGVCTALLLFTLTIPRIYAMARRRARERYNEDSQNKQLTKIKVNADVREYSLQKMLERKSQQNNQLKIELGEIKNNLKIIDYTNEYLINRNHTLEKRCQRLVAIGRNYAKKLKPPAIKVNPVASVKKSAVNDRTRIVGNDNVKPPIYVHKKHGQPYVTKTVNTADKSYVAKNNIAVNNVPVNNVPANNVKLAIAGDMTVEQKIGNLKNNMKLSREG